ncbi:hypothetical protein DF135_05040 [Burkholderia cepacia]|nr:hypothetical protein DF135_05040 [Burkholderia cepacia]
MCAFVARREHAPVSRRRRIAGHNASDGRAAALRLGLGLAWLGLAWLGLAWLGLAWLGLARHRHRRLRLEA